MSQPTIIPNSFQCPNFYVDALLYWLEPSEVTILLMAIREILGWRAKIERREAIIALSVFIEGKTVNGERVAYGTGLNKATIIKALNNLDQFRILTKVGYATQQGQTYRLQDDPEQIDWDGLRERREKRDRQYSSQTSKGRKAAQQAVYPIDQRSIEQTSGLLDRPAVYEIDHQRSIEQTTSGLLDRPPAVYPIDLKKPIRNTEEIEEERQEETASTSSSAADVLLFFSELFAPPSAAQEKLLTKLLTEHGDEKLLDALYWAAAKELSAKDALLAVKRALPTWELPEPPAAAPQPQPAPAQQLPLVTAAPSPEAELWRTVLADLEGQMTRATFDTWLRGTRCLGRNGSPDTLIVEVKNAYAVAWLQNRLYQHIQRTLHRVAGREMEVHFQPSAESGGTHD